MQIATKTRNTVTQPAQAYQSRLDADLLRSIYFWPVFVVSAAAIAWLTAALAPIIAQRFPLGTHEHLLLTWVNNSKPEFAEEYGFLITLVSAPILLFCAHRIVFHSFRARLERLQPWFVRPLVVAAQCFVLGFVAFETGLTNMINSGGNIFQLHSHECLIPRWLFVAIFVGAILIVWFHRRIALLSTQRPRMSAALSCSIAGIFTASQVLPAITFSISEWHRATRYHYNFTASDYAAVAGGHTPLVDFFPVYQRLFTCLTPLFEKTIISVPGFSFLMAGATFLTLSCLFYLFARATKNWWQGLALYIVYCAATFTPIDVDTPSRIYSAVTYFGVMPIRLFLPALTSVFLLNSLSKRTWSKFFVLVLAGLTAVNNSDCGMACLAGVILTLFYNEVRSSPIAETGENLRTRITQFARAAAKIGGLALAGAAIAVSFLVALTYFHSGQLPNLDAATHVQRAYVAFGILFLQIPEHGVQWPVCLSLLASVALVIHLCFSEVNEIFPSLKHRHEFTCIILYWTVFAAISFFWYVGRSHLQNLLIAQAFWLPPVMLTAWYAIYTAKRAFVENKLRSTGAVHFVPAVFSLAFFVFLSSTIFNTDPVGDINRIGRSYVARQKEKQEDQKFLQFFVDNSRKFPIMIVSDDSHLLAARAHLNNVYPFSSAGEIFSWEQVQQLRTVAKDRHVRRLYIEEKMEGIDIGPRIMPTLTKDDFRFLGQFTGFYGGKHRIFDAFANR